MKMFECLEQIRGFVEAIKMYFYQIYRLINVIIFERKICVIAGIRTIDFVFSILAP